MDSAAASKHCKPDPYGHKPVENRIRAYGNVGNLQRLLGWRWMNSTDREKLTGFLDKALETSINLGYEAALDQFNHFQVAAEQIQDFSLLNRVLSALTVSPAKAEQLES